MTSIAVIGEMDDTTRGMGTYAAFVDEAFGGHDFPGMKKQGKPMESCISVHPLTPIVRGGKNEAQETCIGLHVLDAMLKPTLMNPNAVDAALLDGIGAAAAHFPQITLETRTVHDVLEKLRSLTTRQPIAVSVQSTFNHESTPFEQMLGGFGQCKWGGPVGILIRFPNGRAIHAYGRGKTTYLVDPHPRNTETCGTPPLGGGSSILVEFSNFTGILEYVKRNYNFPIKEGASRGNIRYDAALVVPSPVKPSGAKPDDEPWRSNGTLPALSGPLFSGSSGLWSSQTEPEYLGKGKQEEDDDAAEDDGSAKSMDIDATSEPQPVTTTNSPQPAQIASLSGGNNPPSTQLSGMDINALGMSLGAAAEGKRKSRPATPMQTDQLDTAMRDSEEESAEKKNKKTPSPVKGKAAPSPRRKTTTKRGSRITSPLPADPAGKSKAKPKSTKVVVRKKKTTRSSSRKSGSSAD